MNDPAPAVTAETVAAIVDAFNRHDVDDIMSYCAADIVWVMARGPHPWGRRFEGAAAVRDALVERFRSIPDARWEDRGNWVSGEVGVSEWKLTGTTAKGERLELLGCDLWRFRDGKVSRRTPTGSRSTRTSPSPHFSPVSRPASRPGVRSVRSGPKSVAGTTVEARDAAGGRPGATLRAALSGRQGASRRLPDVPASRGAALLPCRPDSAAQAMTPVRNAG